MEMHSHAKITTCLRFEVQTWGIIMLKTKVHVEKTVKSRNWTTIWHLKVNIHPQTQWKNIIRNEQQLPRGIKSKPEVSSCSKLRVLSKKQTSLRIERQSDSTGVLYTLKHNEDTSPGMKNNFPEVLSSILWYYHAWNQGSFQKNIKILRMNNNLTSSR